MRGFGGRVEFRTDVSGWRGEVDISLLTEAKKNRYRACIHCIGGFDFGRLLPHHHRVLDLLACDNIFSSCILFNKRKNGVF